MTTTTSGLNLRRVLGRNLWLAPQPFGPDGWLIDARDGRTRVIVTTANHDGDEWTHASISHPNRMPDYRELVLLHAAAFGDGYAYQVFAPADRHVNIHQYALHLWGRVDGANVLPDFGAHGTI